MSKSRTEAARLVEWARIVLGYLAGQRNDESATELALRPGTVGVWCQRFAAEELKGLRDRQRPGKPPCPHRLGSAGASCEQLEQPPPAGMATWEGGSLTQALGVSDDAVWRRLRKAGIQLPRQRSWCVSTDPQVARKAADILGCTSIHRTTP